MNTFAEIEAKQLGCIRQGKWVFPAVTFTLRAGEMLLIEGSNGAGKSSLLRMLAGFATPAAGDIFWNTKSIQTNLNEYVETLHYLGHTNGIRLGLTVAENLRLASELAQQPLQKQQETISLLQLNAQLHTQTQFLSAGQKRRTALARLWLIARRLWILDEPLTSLDARTQEILLQKIEEHLARGGMCIMASHQPVSLQSSIHRLNLSC